MEFLIRYKIAIILIILVVGLFLVYQFFFNNGNIPGLSASGPSVERTLAGREIISQLNQVAGLNLNKRSLFDDGVINSLIDYKQLVQPEPAGRNNPFVRVGTDGSYLGVPVNTATVVEGI